MKKVSFKKAAVALFAAAALFFAGCSDIAENEAEAEARAAAEAESSDRAAISGVSSFYADNLSHGTFTSNVTSGNYTIYATSAKTVSTPYNSASLSHRLSLLAVLVSQVLTAVSVLKQPVRQQSLFLRQALQDDTSPSSIQAEM